MVAVVVESLGCSGRRVVVGVAAVVVGVVVSVVFGAPVVVAVRMAVVVYGVAVVRVLFLVMKGCWLLCYVGRCLLRHLHVPFCVRWDCGDV